MKKPTLAAILIPVLFALSPTIVVADEAAFGHLTDSPDGQMVLDFVDRVLNRGQGQEAFDRYVAEDFVQHSPMTPGGDKAGTFAALGGLPPAPEGSPRMLPKRVLVDDDLVAVHLNFITQPGTLGSAVIAIFRVEDGKIVEHWDVQQAVPENPANDRGMF